MPATADGDTARMQQGMRSAYHVPHHHFGADRYSDASKSAVGNAHVDPAFRAVMEDRLLELGTHFGIEDFFSGWFRDAPFESIRCVLQLLDSHKCCGVSQTYRKTMPG